jgi:hypothetical protein
MTMPADRPSPSSPLDDADSRAWPDAVGVQERRFPLVALLQLATFWAVIVACVDGAALSAAVDSIPRRPWLAAALLAVALVVGGGLGFVVGLGQLRMWRNAVAGAGVGMLYGIAVLAVYVAPASLAQCLAAAAVLLATTLVLRIRSA